MLLNFCEEQKGSEKEGARDNVRNVEGSFIEKENAFLSNFFLAKKKEGENSKVAACLNEFKRGNCKVRWTFSVEKERKKKWEVID